MRLSIRLAIPTPPEVFADTARTANLQHMSFTHHDRERVCDNTRTCRAAAYSEEEVEPSATVLFTELPVQARLGQARPGKAQL
jgi:hypothetical protein